MTVLETQTDNCFLIVVMIKTTETVTEYMELCEANVTTKKTITVYLNNKLEASAEMNNCIRERRAAFINGDHNLV